MTRSHIGMDNASQSQPSPTSVPSPVTGAETSELHIVFGALCDTLTVQLEKQGLTVSDHAELARIEIIAKAVATVTIHGLMPPSQSDRARRKLLARLVGIVRPSTHGTTDRPAKPREAQP